MTARIRLSLAGCFLALSLPVMASPAGHFDFGQPAPAASATRTQFHQQMLRLFERREVDL